jgi:hypothetical protein
MEEFESITLQARKVGVSVSKFIRRLLVSQGIITDILSEMLQSKTKPSNPNLKY